MTKGRSSDRGQTGKWWQVEALASCISLDTAGTSLLTRWLRVTKEKQYNVDSIILIFWRVSIPCRVTTLIGGVFSLCSSFPRGRSDGASLVAMVTYVSILLTSQSDAIGLTVWNSLFSPLGIPPHSTVSTLLRRSVGCLGHPGPASGQAVGTYSRITVILRSCSSCRTRNLQVSSLPA